MWYHLYGKEQIKLEMGIFRKIWHTTRKWVYIVLEVWSQHNGLPNANSPWGTVSFICLDWKITIFPGCNKLLGVPCPRKSSEFSRMSGWANTNNSSKFVSGKFTTNRQILVSRAKELAHINFSTALHFWKISCRGIRKYAIEKNESAFFLAHRPLHL